MSKIKKYRYRDSGRSTRDSLNRLVKHIDKVGKVKSIKGYRYRSTRQYTSDGDKDYYTNSHEAVLVTGDRGTARFEGFCWGYNGEGPRGLSTLLQYVGLDEDKADNIAFNTYRGNDYQTGTEWWVFL